MRISAGNADRDPSGVGVPDVVPDLSTGRSLIVPTTAQLELALAAANTLEELVEFEKMIAVLKEAGSQFKVVIDEAIRIATCDIVTRRKIGSILLQVHLRGGDRAKDHDDPLLKKLLEDLGKNKVQRCRTIARIDDAHFAEYLRMAAEQREVPTEAGAVRHARRVAKASKSTKSTRSRKLKAKPAAADVCPAIMDAVQRVLGDIDVCIGNASVKCRARLDASTAQEKEILGQVVVSGCDDPTTWLAKLEQLQLRGIVKEAVVLLPPDFGSAWFMLLASGGWHCCFPTGGGTVVAYLGMKSRGFAMTFRGAGAVFRGCAIEGPTQIRK